MDRNVIEYLSSTNHSQRRLLDDDTSVDLIYERKVSVYRSSTVMVQESWGNTNIVCGEEHHYEEFV